MTDQSHEQCIIWADLENVRKWSLETFGPGLRTKGIIDHIKREFLEIQERPESLEWIDVIVLGFDGALRAGYEPQTVLDALKEKWAVNFKRKWPDWQNYSEDEAIEHVRD